MEGRANRIVAAQVEMDAPAVVTVERLDDARESDPAGRLDGRLFGGDDGALRHRQPGGIEEPVRQALVARDVDADRRGDRRHGRPDPLLMNAQPELNEAMPIEPDVGDVAAGRLVEDRLGRWAEG